MHTDIEARANTESIEEARQLIRTLTTHVDHPDISSGKLSLLSSDLFALSFRSLQQNLLWHFLCATSTT